MPPAPHQSMVFVDLETTGSTASVDRITEIGIVELNEEGEVREWSSLVNPQTGIPGFIQSLTGITNDMVAQAPTFAALADEVHARLHGRLFVAHNARFDYGFLKSEFKRLGLEFKAPVLCTVKLSRKLFPQYSKHNLDALVERHGLRMPARHRALADASVLQQFWAVLNTRMTPQALAEAVGELTGRSSWPAHLDPGLLDELPERHGVYLFHDEQDAPLYIGKALNLRQRVLAHFAADRATKDAGLSRQVRRVSWVETPGELGALLKEIALIRQWRPPHNKRGKGGKDGGLSEVCTWRLVPVAGEGRDDAGGGEGMSKDDPDGPCTAHTLQDEALRPELALAHELDWDRHAEPVYGLFNSQKDAIKTLKEIAETAQLCLVALGLEKAVAGRACFAYQSQQCSGACIGRETPDGHARRLRQIMSDWRVQPWPFSGPVLVREGDLGHVLDAWCYLGTAGSEAEARALLVQARPPFDKDTYKVLVSWLPKVVTEPL